MSEEKNDGPVDVKELVRWAERTQRNLDFLASQQAQFSADLQRSREEQKEQWKEQQERWRKADEKWGRTEESIRALLAIVQSHEGEINALQEAQDRTDRQIAATGKQLAETGERVDALVNTVERLVIERRNGGAEESGEAREG